MTIDITDNIGRLTLDLRPSPTIGWVLVAGEAMVPNFRAAFDDDMTLDDLMQFHQGLKQLYTELKGYTVLRTPDGFLDVEAEIDLRGRIRWEITIRRGQGGPNAVSLNFEMNSDQSYLPPLLAQLEAAIDAFAPTTSPSN